MLDIRNTYSTLHTRVIDFTFQEYIFVLQIVLGEDPCVSYASVFDSENFAGHLNEDENKEYFDKFKSIAHSLLESQTCAHLKETIEQDYHRDIQAKATNFNDFTFTNTDAQRILNNLLHDRTQNLSESSVRDILALLKSMYESGSIEQGDSFQKHFITIPKKYDCICGNCNKEMYIVEGVDNRCENCGTVYRWSEEENRFYPEIATL